MTGSRDFRGDIQGLRAIAVGAVVLYHAGVPFLPGGFVGVDIFFVISGFLITSHLLSRLELHGRISFADFYARRARRILPASFLVLLLSVVAALVWFPPLLMREVWRGAVATALYIPNLLFAVEGTDYLAEETPSLFQHYWSLGVEEQFYVAWPAVLAGCWWLIKSRKALLLFLLALVALSFAACVVLTFSNQPWAFFLLPTRGWELGVGGVVAFHLAESTRRLPPAAAAVAGWLGIVGILGSVALFNSSTPFPGYWAAIPVVATGLVIVGGLTPSRLGPRGLLSSRAMLLVGAISYSLYLVHWPAMLIPQAAVGFASPLPLWCMLLIAALCVPAAWLLYTFVEDPARNVKWLSRARARRSLIFAAAGSLMAVVLATGAYGYSLRTPMTTATPAAMPEIVAQPAGTKFVPKNLTPHLREAAEDQPAVYADGCHRSFESTDSRGCLYGSANEPRIVLFGDSHAAQWFPALLGFAEEHGFAVETFTKSSCPSVFASVSRSGVLYSECMVWRTAVVERINAERPAIVLISNYGTAPLVDQARGYGESWEAALGATLDRLTPPIAVIADTPDLAETPSVCLSANLNNADACARDRDFALRSPARAAEARATAARGVPLISLDEFLCNRTSCPAIIGNVLVYRDAHHLTATFSAKLSDVLGEQLRLSLP